MSKKYYTSLLTLVLIVTILFVSQNKSTYSLESDSQLTPKLSLDLEYTNDSEQLKNNIYKLIDKIDNTLIPLYEYNESINLNDNYQFLTRFALNFISNNLAYYEQDVIIGKTYQTIDTNGNEQTTNKYVPIDLIYSITSSIFDRQHYYITNKELTIIDNLVPLVVEPYPIEMNLESITSITKKDDSIFVQVKYQEIDIYYQYEFALNDNKLTIKNLDIEV